MPSSDVSIHYAGAPFGGSFHRIGETLYVTSPYGTANALMGKVEGGLLAEMLLFGLVQAWSRNNDHLTAALTA